MSSSGHLIHELFVNEEERKMILSNKFERDLLEITEVRTSIEVFWWQRECRLHMSPILSMIYSQSKCWAKVGWHPVEVSCVKVNMYDTSIVIVPIMVTMKISILKIEYDFESLIF